MEARLKQELPPIPQKIQAQLSGWANRTDVYQVNSVDAYISAIRAESAALREEIATLRADASKAAEEMERLKRVEEFVECTGRARAVLDRAIEAEKELARERERHQDLRQVVKEYRISGNHNSMCRTGVWAGKRGQIDARCVTCIKADALLEPQPAPTEEPR